MEIEWRFFGGAHAVVAGAGGNGAEATWTWRVCSSGRIWPWEHHRCRSAAAEFFLRIVRTAIDGLASGGARRRFRAGGPVVPELCETGGLGGLEAGEVVRQMFRDSAHLERVKGLQRDYLISLTRR